jgi:hypothetical protein
MQGLTYRQAPPGLSTALLVLVIGVHPSASKRYAQIQLDRWLCRLRSGSSYLSPLCYLVLVLLLLCCCNHHTSPS